MALSQSRHAKRLLFAWEAGANLGHIMPLVRLARRLADAHTECMIAARDLVSTSIALEKSELPFLQAPAWPLHDHLGNEDGQSGYLDLLVTMGFGDPSKLTPVLQAWNTLLDLVVPDAVIADHSPALLALLHARRIPAVAIGNGYTMPPASYPYFPPLRADRAPLLPEARLEQSLVEGLASLGYAAPVSLKAALTTSERLVFSFPELDPYRGWRQETLHLPPDPLPAFIEPPLETRLFVYVGGELPGLSHLVQCIAELPCTVECYLRSASAPLSSFLRLRGVKVHDKPPDLSKLLPQVSHVLSQGGTGLCHAAMAAGRPHIIIPLHGESEMNFHALSAMGIARRLHPGMDANELKVELDRIMDDHELIVRAHQWGKRVSARPQPDGTAALEAIVRDMIQPVVT